jgi:hypothetical protein
MLVTHATITVSGDAAQLPACDARIKLLLAEQAIDGECVDHHGETALCYDLKVRGGIPFPAFAQASLEFPELKFSAEWVNAGAGTRGAATIANGQLTEQTMDKLDRAIESGPPVHVQVALNGKLELALTFYRASTDEWLGYCLDNERDALFRVVRNGGTLDFYATEGSGEWSLHACDAASLLSVMPSPIAIEQSTYLELEQLAQRFAAEWIWFANGRCEEIAIEADRYERYGFTAHDANVRSARLHKMRQEATEGAQVLEFSSLRDEDAWVRDVVARCWLSVER